MNRKAAGLKVSGEINGLLFPAPALTNELRWSNRPVTCSELTSILRLMLQCRDENLTSHSLKCTTLSWCAKAEDPKEQLRLLGRHSSALQDADSVYSRDLCFAPVKALERVLIMIRDESFMPDNAHTSLKAIHLPGNTDAGVFATRTGVQRCSSRA